MLKEAQPGTAGAFSLLVEAMKTTPLRESLEQCTHPVKALGLEEVAVGAVQLPPSSGPTAVDGF